MLELTSPSPRRCDGVSRRDFLKVGALGLGRTDAGRCPAGASRCAAADGRSPASDRSVILIWLDGGPPQHETYDPKPDAPAEFRGPLKAIATAVPGVQVSELLPDHARLMDKMSIIRSLHHDNGDHFAAAHWMLTGYLGSNAINMAPQYPSAGSIIARIKGAKQPGMPAYVGLPNTHSVGIAPGYHGAAYLGSAYNPFNRRRRSQLREVPRAEPDIARRRRRAPAGRPPGPARRASTRPAGPSTRRASWRASTASSRRRSRWSSVKRRARRST